MASEHPDAAAGVEAGDPRIAPLEPPYAPEVQAAFDTLMRGAPPLLLFRTVARNPRVLQRMMAGGLLDRGSIALRERELMILRTCARCGAEYEWGVHVAIFGSKAGWTPAQLHSTVHGGPDDDCWSPTERLLVCLADQLHDTDGVDEALWAELARSFTPEQLVELLMLAGLYHAVSFVVNGAGVPREAFAPRFPAEGDAPPVRAPRAVVRAWVDAFERHDAAAAAALYHDDAVNHQVAAGDPAVGRPAIEADHAAFFRAFPDSHTHVVSLHEDGEWAILEWTGGGTWRGEFAGRPPNGRAFTLRGCGFFHVVDGRIKFQRGYWDRASWFGQLGIPVA